MNLQDKLDQLKADFESNAPPEALAVMHKATQDLKTSGLMSKALKKGDTLPGFSLPDQKGNRVSSAELLEKGPLVLNVYRGVW